MIADETQTGFAHTGELFAMEQQLSGLDGTYGGNPLEIVAAHAVLDIIEEEGFCARANELGLHLCQRLKPIRTAVPELAEVRDPGFMVAAEFNTADGYAPSPNLMNRVRADALKRKLILLTCGVHGNVIRFLAPLTIDETHFAEALDILEASIAAARTT